MFSSCFVILGHDASIFYTPNFPCNICKDSLSVVEHAKYLYRKRYGINNDYFHYKRYDYKIHIKEYGHFLDIKYESAYLDSINNNKTTCQMRVTPEIFILKPKCKVVKYQRNYNNVDNFVDFGWKTLAISDNDMLILRNSAMYNSDTLTINEQVLQLPQTQSVSNTLLHLLAQQNIISNYKFFIDKDAQQEIISNPKDYLQIFLVGQLPVRDKHTQYKSFYIAVIYELGKSIADKAVHYKGYLINVHKNQLISISKVSEYYNSNSNGHYYLGEYTVDLQNGLYMVCHETNSFFIRSFTFDYQGHVSVK
jgi:hypothetical protein